MSTTTATSTPSSSLPQSNVTDAQGSAQLSQGVSLETFLASLSVAAIVFGIELIAFTLARKKLARIYEVKIVSYILYCDLVNNVIQTASNISSS